MFFQISLGLLQTSRMSSSEKLIQKWEQVLRITLLSEVEPGSRKTSAWINVAISLFILSQAVRLGFTSILDDTGVEHFYGHTVIALGQFWKTSSLIFGFVLVHLASYRLLFAWWQFNHLSITRRTLKKICIEKKRFVEITLKLMITVSITGSLQGLIVCIFFCYINVRNSDTMIEVVFWILWTPVDVIVISLSIVTYMIVQCVAGLVMIHQREACCRFISLLDDNDLDIRKVVYSYTELKKTSEMVNSFVSKIVGCIIYFSTPTICVAVFATSETHGFVQLCFAALTIAYSFLSIVVVYLFANLSDCPNQVNNRLLHRVTRVPSTRVKLYLLMLMEDLGSESSQLGMYTMNGSRYDVLAVAQYVADIATNYSLVLTLKDALQ